MVGQKMCLGYRVRARWRSRPSVASNLPGPTDPSPPLWAWPSPAARPLVCASARDLLAHWAFALHHRPGVHCLSPGSAQRIPAAHIPHPDLSPGWSHRRHPLPACSHTWDEQAPGPWCFQATRVLGGSRSLVWNLAGGCDKEGFPAPEGWPLQPPTHLPRMGSFLSITSGATADSGQGPLVPSKRVSTSCSTPAVSWHGGQQMHPCLPPARSSWRISAVSLIQHVCQARHWPHGIQVFPAASSHEACGHVGELPSFPCA